MGAGESMLPQRALEAAAHTGKYEMEGWRVRKDGTTFWANVVINAFATRTSYRADAKECAGRACSQPARLPRNSASQRQPYISGVSRDSSGNAIQIVSGAAFGTSRQA